MKKLNTIKGLLAAAALATVALSVTGCEGLEEANKSHAEEVVKNDDRVKHDGKKAEEPKADTVAQEEAPEPEPTKEEKPEPPPAPEFTTSQEQAIASALSYLDTMDFSKTGLIEQLEYEQFSHADAVFALDHVEVDWNQQAARSAKSYLDTMPFSRGELIDQLVYEGYTLDQATYGVNQTGL